MIKKLPKRLVQNRHGIYYLRVIKDGVEKRKSLKTRDPHVAAMAAYSLGYEIMAGQNEKHWTVKIDGGGALTVETDGTQQDHENALEALKLALATGYQQRPVHPVADAAAEAILENLKGTNLLVGEAIEQYFKNRANQLSEGSRRTYETPLNLLREKVGHFKLAAVTYREVDELTRNLEKTLALKTIKNYTRTWRSLFEYFVERGELDKNPVSLPNYGKQVAAMLATRNHVRRPYGKDDLEKLFNPEQLKTYKKPCLLWLPILGLYTGARLETLCRLETRDFVEYQPGHWAVNFRHDKEGKERIIPLHPDLLKIGLLTYKNDIDSICKSGRLFPHLNTVRGRSSHAPSKQLMDVRKALMLSEGVDFHSFRTTIISCLQFNGCPGEHRKIFVGHESGDDVHERNYSKADFTPVRLVDMIFPYLDFKKYCDFEFPNWQYESGRFDKYLARSITLKRRRARLKRHLESKLET